MQKQIIEKETVQTRLNFKTTQSLLELIHPKMGVESMTRWKGCETYLASMYRCWKPIAST
jgi:hypothetical protein